MTYQQLLIAAMSAMPATVAAHVGADHGTGLSALMHMLAEHAPLAWLAILSVALLAGSVRARVNRAHRRNRQHRHGEGSV